jgi:hypothetical protein
LQSGFPPDVKKMKKIVPFVAVFSLFAFAQAESYATSYANELVLRDCGGKAFALSNDPNLARFVGQPVNVSNIGLIIGVVAQLSRTDPAAKTTPQAYFTCGDYVMTGGNGVVYWRGLEIKPPSYLIDAEAQMDELKRENGGQGQEIAALKRDVSDLKEKFGQSSVFLAISLAISLFLFLALVYKSLSHERIIRGGLPTLAGGKRGDTKRQIKEPGARYGRKQGFREIPGK